MSTDDIELDNDAVRQIAATELASSISAKQSILEEHSASFRWLMASMLAINGGGLVSLANQASIDEGWRVAAATSFYVGVLAALAIAWLGQMSARKMLTPLGEAIGFWSMVSSTGHFNQETHSAVGLKLEAAMQFGRRTRWAGWLSVLAFSAGLFSSVWGGVLADRPAEPQVSGDPRLEQALPVAISNDR